MPGILEDSNCVIALPLKFCTFRKLDLVKMRMSEVVFNMLSSKSGVVITLWGSCDARRRKKLFVNCRPPPKRVKLHVLEWSCSLGRENKSQHLSFLLLLVS